MHLPEVKSVLEALILIGFIGFSPLFRRKNREEESESRESNSPSFWLSLISGVCLLMVAVACFHYIRDHHGDYANYLMIMGVLIGGMFGAGLLLRAFVELLRGAFSGRR